MVLKTINPHDSNALLIHSSSPQGTAGNPIINNAGTANGTIFEFQSGYNRTTVTLDDVSANTNILEDGQPNQHTIVNGGGLINSGIGIEAESIIFVRALDSSGNQTGPTISITVFSKGGVTSDVWGFATADQLIPGTLYVKVSGSNAGSSTYDSITCFVQGTYIDLGSGASLVEDLLPGQILPTLEGEFHPILRVLSRHINGDMLAQNPKLYPIRITAGSLGQNLPRRDLLVSRQHRMLVSSKISERMFDESQVLVAAIHLTDLPGIYVDTTVDEVTYYHILFGKHQVICAEGAPTESFLTGAEALKTMSEDDKDEINSLFPSMKEKDYNPQPARFIPIGKKQKQLVARHKQNHKPLLSAGLFNSKRVDQKELASIA